MVSTIGMDPMTGSLRFTFGNMNMMDGIEFVVVMVGMFGVGEVLFQISKRSEEDKKKRQQAQIASNTAEAFPTAKGVQGQRHPHRHLRSDLRGHRRCPRYRRRYCRHYLLAADQEFLKASRGSSARARSTAWPSPPAPITRSSAAR